jgi:hypothetical protein
LGCCLSDDDDVNNSSDDNYSCQNDNALPDSKRDDNEMPLTEHINATQG